MNNPKFKNDLWTEFLEDDDSDYIPAKPKGKSSDGSEWSGNFDRRKVPRDEPKQESDCGSDNG